MTAADAGDDAVRCSWGVDGDAMQRYHDTVWGVPQRDATTLFEFLTLEGAQAGLSWRTILLKHQGYRNAFDDFDVERIAAYTDADVARCVADAGIVRNRAKIESTITNAQAWLRLADPVAFVWSYVDGVPLQNHWSAMDQLPASTPTSDRMSKDMKKLGFRFVGSTILYAYMQACGLVNDHFTGCFRHDECAALG